ncbi:hypothetical protein E2C01_060891 [Portunus trituberculatus]|uniref:Uncharacterized protein n=1 Tax=Portunus trituberculatus TaxID=210409 RepID=A0A5B7HAA2_PORTR|nr:hypothetical protein [Portunus trituberculatus]
MRGSGGRLGPPSPSELVATINLMNIDYSLWKTPALHFVPASHSDADCNALQASFSAHASVSLRRAPQLLSPFIPSFFPPPVLPVPVEDASVNLTTLPTPSPHPQTAPPTPVPCHFLTSSIIP